MATDLESKALLRETIEKHIHGLAEDLLYWMEELNKLDAALLEGKDPLAVESAAETALKRWTARTDQAPTVVDGDAPASGK